MQFPLTVEQLLMATSMATSLGHKGHSKLLNMRYLLQCHHWQCTTISKNSLRLTSDLCTQRRFNWRKWHGDGTGMKQGGSFHLKAIQQLNFVSTKDNSVRFLCGTPSKRDSSQVTSKELGSYAEQKLEQTVRELMTILREKALHSQIAVTPTQSQISTIVQLLLNRQISPRNILHELSKSHEIFAHSTQAWVEALDLAKELGLDSTQVIQALVTIPRMFDRRRNSISQTFDTLRALGFYDGQIKKIILFNPEILTVNPKEMTRNFNHLLCLIPKSELAKMILKCPKILLNGPDESQSKFDYVSLEMGIEPKYMAKTEFLKHDLLFIETRHVFLSRAGLYEKPDKRGRTTIENPTFKNIVDVDDRYFATRVAGISLAEYKTFVKVYAQEKENEVADEWLESDSDID